MANGKENERGNGLILLLGLALLGGAVAFTLSKRDSGTTAPPTPATCASGSSDFSQIGVRVVNNAGTPIENAQVRVDSGIEQLTQLTNSSGYAVFNLKVCYPRSNVQIAARHPMYGNIFVPGSTCLDVVPLTSRYCGQVVLS